MAVATRPVAAAAAWLKLGWLEVVCGGGVGNVGETMQQQGSRSGPRAKAESAATTCPRLGPEMSLLLPGWG